MSLKAFVSSNWQNPVSAPSASLHVQRFMSFQAEA